VTFFGLIGATMKSQTLNISPKVAVPGFVGLATAASVCTLHHYGVSVDAGTAATGIVIVMVMLGWITPPDNAIASKLKNGVDLK
jgi:hypothetical protein